MSNPDPFITYEENQHREACVRQVEEIVTRSSGFPVLQEVMQSIRDGLGTSGVCLVRQTHTIGWTGPALVELHCGSLSRDTMRELSLREERIRCATGPLGLAWDALRPMRWDKREAKELAADCLLLKPVRTRVRNMLVAPIYRQRTARLVPALERYEVLGYLCLFNKHKTSLNRRSGKDYWPFTQEDELTATILAKSIAIALTFERMMECAILAVVEALDRRDPRNAEHSRQVADHVAEIGTIIYQDEPSKRPEDWDQFEFRDVRDGWYAGLLHDVGKIGMPDSVLKGIERLSGEAEHFRRIHSHTSAAIVEQITGLRPEIVQAVTEHHECFQGPEGYLHKTQGIGIGRLARLIAVADAYDSMRRSHGEGRGFSKTAAYAQLQRLKGTKLDGYVVDAFLKTDEFKEVRALLARREQAGKKTLVLAARGAAKNFVSPEYCCTILYHEIGRGVLGMDQGKITARVTPDRLWCDHECEFSLASLVTRIEKSIGQKHPHLNLTERARAAELAFLHIRWGTRHKHNQAVLQKILSEVESKALKRHVLPVAMRQGVGILVPQCSCGQAFGLAQEFHKAIADVYDKASRQRKEPVIGVAYVPNKDTIGCTCIVGCAMIASAYALPRAKEHGAIVFFERHQLDVIKS